MSTALHIKPFTPSYVIATLACYSMLCTKHILRSSIIIVSIANISFSQTLPDTTKPAIITAQNTVTQNPTIQSKQAATATTTAVQNAKAPSDTNDISFFNKIISSFSPKKRLQPVLVNEGEGAIEKNLDHVPEDAATKLILEPEPTLPLVLVQEDDTQEPHQYGASSVTVLIPETEKTAPTLLVNKTEEAVKTIMYLEPEFDPPAVVYVENEQELSEEVRAQNKKLFTTRLLAEPEEEDAPTKTAVCFGQEVIELPQDKCNQNKKSSKHKSTTPPSPKYLDDTGIADQTVEPDSQSTNTSLADESTSNEEEDNQPDSNNDSE